MLLEKKLQQVRKIKPTRLSVSGHLPFKDGISLPYESTLERDFLIFFVYQTNVSEIVSQPVRIPFEKNGVTYSYTPDFFVRFNDGSKPMIIEVKPKSKWQLHWHEWKKKWKTAIAFCKQHGYIFHIYGLSPDTCKNRTSQNYATFTSLISSGIGCTGSI